jgi:mono/diheme cytochrome c family protein
MKRILPLLAVLLLTACNYTLAADITPPPDYIPPTPMPTLGPLFPASAPSVENGRALYTDHCAACHGETGMGDGPQGIQLEGVTVPALALPEIAGPFSPAQWYTIVSQGNLQRYMPPFIGALSEQERWDVVAYAISLHSSPEEVARGRQLFESSCATCPAAYFSDQPRMAALSTDDLARLIREGNDQIPAFGKDLSGEEIAAVAAYLRTLSFGGPPPAETAAGASPAAPTESGPVSNFPEGTGSVSGSVVDSRGDPLPAGLAVVLHGYDHAQSGGPQEVITLDGLAGADGRFSFDGVSLPENRIFLAEVEYQGIQYRSDFAAVTAGDSAVSLPPLKVYEASTDLNLLQFGQIHIYSDFATQGTAQFLEIFTFTNPSQQAVLVPTDGTSLPFIALPEGAQNPGFEAGQDSAPLVSASDGIAVLPSDQPYSLIAFFNLPYEKELEFHQDFVLAAPSILVLIPEGIKVQGDRITPGAIQPVQGANFQTFRAEGLQAGGALTLTLSGRPKAVPDASGTTTRQKVLVGLGALGLVLILAGAWLYMRDRGQVETDAGDADEFDSSDEVMDAILALDDLHRAGKLPDDAYQKRRAELKEVLKEMG